MEKGAMNPGKPKNRTLECPALLTVGQVATLAGVSADTIRSWERKGMLNAQRTPGGQRRFDRAEIEKFVRRGSPHTRRQSAPTPDEFDEPRLDPTEDSTGSLAPDPDSMILHSADPLVTEARAEIEAIRAENIRRVTEARLTELKNYGYSFARGVPAEWRARVALDLEEFVTARQFPAHLSQREAFEFIRSRVNRILKLYRDQTANEATVRRLLNHGKFCASLATFSWNYDDSQKAVREITRELERCVRSDWTEADVKRLVEDAVQQRRKGGSGPVGPDNQGTTRRMAPAFVEVWEDDDGDEEDDEDINPAHDDDVDEDDEGGDPEDDDDWDESDDSDDEWG